MHTMKKQRMIGYCTIALTAFTLFTSPWSTVNATGTISSTPMPTSRVLAPLNNQIDQAGNQLRNSMDKGVHQISRIRPMEAPVQPLNTNRNTWGWGWLGLLGLTGLFGLFRPNQEQRARV